MQIIHLALLLVRVVRELLHADLGADERERSSAGDDEAEIPRLVRDDAAVLGVCRGGAAASVNALHNRKEGMRERTAKIFHRIVNDKVHELIGAFQRARHWKGKTKALV